ncbi:MAG: acyclic terpene utilization AtuA family protein [Bacteroidota bacterium]
MKEKIRIASGQGFWGDLQTAPIDQVRKGQIDYMMLDYLAEVTMSIMQKQKLKDPKLGYAKDLISVFDTILPDIVRKGIKVITNGGGVNPIACRDAIFEVAKKHNIANLKIGVVYGDDILPDIDNLASQGMYLDNMETGEKLSSVRKNVISANVYFGAQPIVEALKQGAQIVITGRTTDTGLTLAPMVYEFDWKWNDWNKIAAGTVAGHILECGGQASGGNFTGDWKSVPDLANIGFPIAEAYPDGRFVVTKHEHTGGLVSSATVKEQLLYEIGNPKNYITPDCIADFTSIHLKDLTTNRVEVSGIKGSPATDSYKVSMAYFDGYTAFSTLTYAWPDALEKAKKADEILRTRLSNLGLQFEEIRTEFLGYNSSFGPLATHPELLNEVVMRVGVRGNDKNAMERFSREIAPLILTGPPSVTGFAAGRPKPSEVIAYWPALLPKTAVTPKVEVSTI